jgi:type IV pilus assembly protein PilF
MKMDHIKAIIPLVTLSVCVLLSACTTTVTSGQSSKKSVTAPDRAIMHAQLARGYMAKQQYAVAKEELEKGLERDPNSPVANYVMALLMLELEQYDIAEESFRVAVKARPVNASAAHDFGMFLCQTQRQLESLEYFELATSDPLFEQRPLSYMRAGECLARVKDPRAASYLKRSLKENPSLKPALYYLADIYYADKNFLSARAYIERFFAITKPQPVPLLLAYKIESAMGAADQMEHYKKLLLEEFPGSRQARELRNSLR